MHRDGVPFSGDLQACLQCLRVLPLEDIRRFIRFTGVKDRTAWGWLMDPGSPPQGVNWLLSAYFFELNGWDVEEISSLDSSVKPLLELWAYGIAGDQPIISTAEIILRLEYQSQNTTNLLRAAYGESIFAPKQSRLAVELVEEFFERLEARKAQLLKEFAIDLGNSNQAQQQMPVPEPRNPRQRVARLVELLQEVFELATWLNSNEATDVQRASLVQELGLEFYARLTVILNMLKSRRHRAEGLGSK